MTEQTDFPLMPKPFDMHYSVILEQGKGLGGTLVKEPTLQERAERVQVQVEVRG